MEKPRPDGFLGLRPDREMTIQYELNTCLNIMSSLQIKGVSAGSTHF